MRALPYVEAQRAVGALVGAEGKGCCQASSASRSCDLRTHRRLAAMRPACLVPSLTTRHGGPSGALGLGLGSVSARRTRLDRWPAPARQALAAAASSGRAGPAPVPPRIPQPSPPRP